MTEPRTILFVCQHGAAKSVIAAQYLQRLARERGLSLECSAAGLEPDDSVPSHVVAGLRDDGFEPSVAAPRLLTADVLHSADTVVSFGCDLSGVGPVHDSLITWEGVPAVSDGYAAARDEITHRLHGLLDDLNRRM